MNSSQPQTSNFGKWMALTAALLGWLFDGLEMGLFPLVQHSALNELVDGADRSSWVAIITSFFLIGAATGGVLFGWLGDRIGRVRSMMLSVLTYALVSGMCGFATEAWQIGVLRFIAALGMGGEWSLGVALINEIWPDSSRAFLAGLIGAAANVGYLLIAVVSLGLATFVHHVHDFLLTLWIPSDWVERLLGNGGWRFLMMLGAVPALLTFFIRIFVPESARWEKERGKGTTSHWANQDLLGVLVGAIGACGIILLWIPKIDLHWSLRVVGSLVCFAIVLVGYTFPLLRFLQRVRASSPQGGLQNSHTFQRMLLAAVLSGVALLGTWGSVQQAPYWAGTIVAKERAAEAKALNIPVESLPDKPKPASAYTQIASALGAIIGTIVAAMLGGWLGRRITYFMLCIASFASIQLFFQSEEAFNWTYLILAFVVGGISASFYGWLPLYLPELFPTAVRATGQGFGFNFGRVLAAIGVLQLSNLAVAVGGLPKACAALSFVYVVGIIVIWFVPETKGQPLPD